MKFDENCVSTLTNLSEFIPQVSKAHDKSLDDKNLASAGVKNDIVAKPDINIFSLAAEF